MRTINQIKEDIAQTKLEIQKLKDMPSDWRIGKDRYDPQMVAEREEFFELMNKTNQIMQSDKQRIDELSKKELAECEELSLLEEHHNLMMELLINFYA